MKLSHLIAISLCTTAVCSPGIHAQGPGGKGDFMKRLDKNGDGALSEAEVPESLWTRMAALDKNEDGKVSVEELRAGASGMRRPGNGGKKETGKEPETTGKSSRPNFTQLVTRLDRNQDGSLTKEEVPDGLWSRLSRLDRNDDGKVGPEEIRMTSTMMGESRNQRRGGNRNGPSGARGVMSSFDENSDGKLTQAEVSASMWAKISRLDENADGEIALAELSQAWE